MSKYEATPTGFNEGYTDRYEGAVRATRAAIEVRPPIAGIGEGFNDAILGQDQNGIRMRHVLTSAEVTTFAVEAALYDPNHHAQMIHTAAQRIAQLLNEQGNAALMAAENPFPRPTYHG